MRALTVEFLEQGALPLYCLDCRVVQTVIDRTNPGGRWEHRGRFGRGKVLIQLWEEDVMMVDLRDKLRGWLDQLGDQDGSLIFPIRGVHTLPENENGPAYGPFIMAGLSFIPNVEFGYPLNGEDDPIDIIMQTCEADGVDNDALHPAALYARQQRVEQRIIWEAEMAKDRAKRAIVNARSLALLRDCLTPAQLDELEAYGMFHVTGGDGYTYAIQRDYASVFRVEDGERTYSYCIHPKGRIPSYDLMLGLKLMLEACPERFHAVANYQRLVA